MKEIIAKMFDVEFETYHYFGTKVRVIFLGMIVARFFVEGNDFTKIKRVTKEYLKEIGRI